MLPHKTPHNQLDLEKSKSNLQNSPTTPPSSTSSEDEHNYHDVLSTVEEERHSDSSKGSKKTSRNIEHSEPVQRF